MFIDWHRAALVSKCNRDNDKIIELSVFRSIGGFAMSLSFVGRIDRVEFGSGTWVLITDASETYELMSMPAELAEVKGKVKITGNIREDVMTLAMVGSVLEVESFEIVN
jgi:hypothetical protein